jgi:hypothetical protein
VLLLLAGAALLLAASATLAVGAYGGLDSRVVISYATAEEGARASALLHSAAATVTRQLEDQVAPELSSLRQVPRLPVQKSAGKDTKSAGKVFSRHKKSAAFIPVEVDLYRHFSRNAAVCMSRHKDGCQ